MADLAAVLGRGGVPVDRVVSDLVEGARGSVVEALGAVVARDRAVAVVEDQVKPMIRDLDKRIDVLTVERETLRPVASDLADRLPGARAAVEVARRQKQRALAAGDRGQAPDVAAVEVKLRDLEQEATDARVRLRTVSNHVMQAERDKSVLSDLLARLERVPVPDSDLLQLLGGTLAGEG